MSMLSVGEVFLCVISGFNRGVNEIFAVLRCYEAMTGKYRRSAITYQFVFKVQSVQSWSLNMGLISCPKSQ